MAWVKIDDSFADHPKLAGAGPLGMALQVAALCYCNRYLTDGFIPQAVAPRLLYFEGLAEPGEVIGRLIEAGIWIEVEGGYQIHDYLEYQPSKADIEATREQRREAGKKGGKAKGKQSAEQDAKQNESKVLSKSSSTILTQFNPGPVPGPVPIPERDMSMSSTRSVNAMEQTDDDINLCVKWEQAIGGIVPPSLFAKFESYTADGMEREVIAWAIDQSIGADRPQHYVITVLNDLMSADPPILTMSALRQRERQRKSRASPKAERTLDDICSRDKPPEPSPPIENQGSAAIALDPNYLAYFAKLNQAAQERRREAG